MSDQEHIEIELKNQAALAQQGAPSSLYEELYFLSQMFKPWPHGGE